MDELFPQDLLYVFSGNFAYDTKRLRNYILFELLLLLLCVHLLRAENLTFAQEYISRVVLINQSSFQTKH